MYRSDNTREEGYEGTVLHIGICSDTLDRIEVSDTTDRTTIVEEIDYNCYKHTDTTMVRCMAETVSESTEVVVDTVVDIDDTENTVVVVEDAVEDVVVLVVVEQ